MPTSAWSELLAGWPWFRGEGAYPIPAYSEFLPPPRLARKPYGTFVSLSNPSNTLDSLAGASGLDGARRASEGAGAEKDPWGWPVSEYEQALEVRPSLERLGQHLVTALEHLGAGRPGHGIARNKLVDNPYWPAELADRAGKLAHERYVVLAPLALSRTQDDKGRVRWTLFGASEQGPARPFWKGFYTAPDREAPADEALGFLRRLLAGAYGVPKGKLADLRRAGLRVLPEGDDSPFGPEGPLPGWTEPLLWEPGKPLRGVKYLLTFRAFERLPAKVRKAYLGGGLHLLPFPGSLLFWGVPAYHRLARGLPLALQIPLLQLTTRREAPGGVRVPQSGWMHEARPGEEGPSHHGPVRNTFKRTHRWDKVLRDEDELALLEREDPLLHVLFSSLPDDVGLYGKPMARNAQLWTTDYDLLLDGPHATADDVRRALEAVERGGEFGYRFQYPAMRVGRHEVYWHAPLVAFLSPRTKEPEVLLDAPAGYLTAYRADHPDPARPIELWPRLLKRELHADGVELFRHATDPRPNQTVRNVRKVLDVGEVFGAGKLPRAFARDLLNLPREETLEGWLDGLPGRSADAGRCRRLVDGLRGLLGPDDPAPPPEAHTFGRTARRGWEVRYWKTIASLAEGKYLNKNNADCVRDPATQHMLVRPGRDLDALGEHLIGHYTKAVAAAGLGGKALVGEVPFSWQTDFDFSWMGGWLANQQGHSEERDVVLVIPGRDRTQAVVMADHYDTAYMADRYEKQYGGRGARLAACGADDNHSATAALMLAAPVFLDMSKRGELACDVWLVHLTGEEFPADCLGARHLCQLLVEGTLRLRLPGGKWRDLSGVEVRGVYVLDMVAHNNDHDRNVFQVSPGVGRESLWLAYQAHRAAEAWNAGAAEWNERPSRRGKGPGRRSPYGAVVPPVAEHPRLHAEVRLPWDPRSTLYNTDGQIFSDAGVPVVLFMENYDINRAGYHDTHDTMANIDLDYGSAVAAIAIESVARAATQTPWA